MKSELPKCLHTICGVPMVEAVARSLRAAGVTRSIVVIGHGGEDMQRTLGDGYEYAWQREQLGTGHAVLAARDLILTHRGPVVTCFGDSPLLTPEVFQSLIRRQQETGAACVFAGAKMPDPFGYGRILRDEAGRPARIVEEKDADAATKQINEVNVGVYCFDGPALCDLLPRLTNDNAQCEYYLTDTVDLAATLGLGTEVVMIPDPSVVQGVNDRWQLAQAAKALRQRVNRMHAVNGVTIVDPDTAYIGLDVEIAPDAVIEPNVHLLGKTRIDEGARIGPDATVKDSRVGRNSVVVRSHVDRSHLGAHVWVGPFANLRPGTVLEDEVKIGDFVEIKNAVLRRASKASHLTYLGDAEVGENANVGAGTITCNYDGFNKHRTTIGKDAFVGSHSTLVAPVTIGEGALIAAGSTITRDVPGDALGLGRAKQENKDRWASDYRRRKQSQQ